jgi:radical SAM protein with 4Fe4S-binding SPASM domain
MKIELFKKICDDLLDFSPKIKVLRLYKDGEPTLNKKLPEMISYAKSKNVAEKIDTTTNASLLTESVGKAIINAGLDRINISIEGVNNAQYKNFSDVDLEFEKVVENVRFFYENKKQCEMLVKINGDTLSKEDINKFFETFGDITDKIHVEHIMSCWPNFEFDGDKAHVNSEKGIYGQEIKEVDACAYAFYSFAINSDGKVSLCFLDWGRKLIIGDTNNEKIIDIWNGQELKNYQKMFLKGDRKKHPVCGNCGQMTHGNPDNIDKFKEELLAKI